MGFEEKNGNYAGFDIELAQYVSKKLGITVHFQPIDWDMKETELQTVRLTPSGMGIRPDERREKVAFTIPYMQNTQILVVKKTSGIHSVEDMTGKVLGAQNGSSGMLDFEEHPEVLKNRVKGRGRRPIPKRERGHYRLEEWPYRRLLIDRVYADYYLTTEGIADEYDTIPSGFESESLAVGVRPADKSYSKRWTKPSRELYQEGIFQQISQKWFGEDVATPEVKGQK